MYHQMMTSRSRISLMLRMLHKLLNKHEDGYKDPEKDDDEDPEEDPSKEHDPEDDDEDPEEDLSEEHKHEDGDTREEDPFEGSDETESFEEDGTTVTPPPPGCHRARISAPLGHRAAMIRMREDIPEEDMPPQRRFVLTAPPPWYDVAESSIVAARAPRAVDRAEDVGYVRALQAFEHRMVTSIEEVNLRTDCRDIRLEIDVVRGQRTTYETELHE
ncbi:hypothetical protein Tco_0023047, partial [Tanacetum coccineum]